MQSGAVGWVMEFWSLVVEFTYRRSPRHDGETEICEVSILESILSEG